MKDDLSEPAEIFQHRALLSAEIRRQQEEEIELMRDKSKKNYLSLKDIIRFVTKNKSN